VSANTPENETLFPEPRKAPEPPGYDERPIHPQSSLRYWARRIGGPIVAAVVIGFQWILKLKFVLFAVAKLKFVTSAFTLVLSVGAYTLLWGWRFAVLFVLLLFVHELGHALWMRKEGIPAGAPVFIPFLGAVIAMKGMPRNAYVEAKIGLAGPVLGTLGAAVVLGLGELQDSDLLRAAASTGFLLNLFNLLPIVPLDGGRAMAAIHPSLWIAGIAGLAVLLVFSPNVILILILVLGGREAWVRWRARKDTAGATYYTVARSQRIVIAAVYVGLAAVCVLGMRAGYVNT
jgi:Zn-dependent protease